MATIPQRKLREIVLQLLYSHDLAAPSKEDLTPMMCEELGVTRAHMRLAFERAEEILAVREAVDQQIRQYSIGYALERIPRVERNILRLAFFELFYEGSIPPKAVIAEALRLAKKFSAPESTKFINAVLDAALKGELKTGEEEDDNKEEIFFGNQAP